MNSAVITPFVSGGRWAAQDRVKPAPLATATESSVQPAAPLLSLRDLRVSFDTGMHLVPVLHGVNLDMQAGETLGVVGESGCGKSVTWMAVLGLLGRRARISGKILFNGDNIAAYNERELTRVRGKRIAMIFRTRLLR